MNKNTVICGCIPTARLMLAGMVFAADASKNQPTKEKTPIELWDGQHQPLTLV